VKKARRVVTPTPPSAGGPKAETVMRSLRETREAVRTLRTATREELQGIAGDLRALRDRLDRLEAVVDTAPVEGPPPEEYDAQRAAEGADQPVLPLGQP